MGMCHKRSELHDIIMMKEAAAAHKNKGREEGINTDM